MTPGTSGAASQRSPRENRHERIYEIFAAAIRLPSENRATFLNEACAGDVTVQADVERLLAADAGTASMVYVSSGLPQFLPGKELAGRFRIARFIASGGMSDVYEVEDMQLGEHVALKTIRPEMIGDARALSRFKREIQYAKRVTHPNVCRIHDLGSHREGEFEILFLTMELLDGDTLAARLRAAGRISTEEALPILIQMADALAAAHDVGIIHRDFKTSNVMLAGAARGAVVTDFGLARSSGIGDDPSLTDAGMVVGTPAYMAPEQLMHGELTPATDIYALGLVMYEMFTGRKPFDSAMKRLCEAPADPAELTPGLDPRWGSVILRCLERDPAQRFQSAKEVARALTIQAATRSQAFKRIQTIGKKRGAHVSAGVLTGAAIVLAVLSAVWANFESVLHFSIALQRADSRQTFTVPADAVPALVLHDHDRVRLRISSAESGYLYVIVEDNPPSSEGRTLRCLFPPDSRNQTAFVPAGQSVDVPPSRPMELVDRGRSERLWIVWSRRAVNQLGSVEGEPGQARRFLVGASQAAYQASKPSDTEVTLKSRGTLLVRLLALDHR